MRDWCRGCGARGDNLVFATEADRWVEDEDDYGFLYCPDCIAELTEQYNRLAARFGWPLIEVMS